MVGERKTGVFYWDKKAAKAFNMLKKLFIITPILRIFDLLLRTRLETDISKFAIRTIISQLFHDPIYRRDN
jgi:hypothetical protein